MPLTPRALPLALALSVAAAALSSTRAALADPKQECAAAYEKTQTLREQGKLIEAREQALSCGVPTCSVYVVKDCTQWLAEIDASMPTVVAAAEDQTGADTLDARLSIDGHAARTRLDGKAIAVNPGEHVFRFEIAGAEPVEVRVLVRQGEKNRRVAASFKKAPPALPPVPPVVPPPVAVVPVLPPPGPPPPSEAKVPVWAWVSGGAGLVLLGVGAGFGGSALSAQSQLHDLCGADLSKCPRSKEAKGTPLANQRTVGLDAFLGLGAAGLAGITIGVIGIATRGPSGSALPPQASQTSVGLSVRPGGFSLDGRF